jgi:hypothetical protein
MDQGGGLAGQDEAERASPVRSGDGEVATGLTRASLHRLGHLQVIQGVDEVTTLCLGAPRVQFGPCAPVAQNEDRRQPAD